MCHKCGSLFRFVLKNEEDKTNLLSKLGTTIPRCNAYTCSDGKMFKVDPKFAKIVSKISKFTDFYCLHVKTHSTGVICAITGTSDKGEVLLPELQSFLSQNFSEEDGYKFVYCTYPVVKSIKIVPFLLINYENADSDVESNTKRIMECLEAVAAFSL